MSGLLNYKNVGVFLELELHSLCEVYIYKQEGILVKLILHPLHTSSSHLQTKITYLCGLLNYKNIGVLLELELPSRMNCIFLQTRRFSLQTNFTPLTHK